MNLEFKVKDNEKREARSVANSFQIPYEKDEFCYEPDNDLTSLRMIISMQGSQRLGKPGKLREFAENYKNNQKSGIFL